MLNVGDYKICELHSVAMFLSSEEQQSVIKQCRYVYILLCCLYKTFILKLKNFNLFDVL